MNEVGMYCSFFRTRTVAVVGACLFVALDGVHGAPTVPRAPQWEIFEMVLHAGTVPANPFTDTQFTVTIVDPGGTRRSVDGFYDGDGDGGQIGDVWKVRFSPERIGIWEWTTHSNLPSLDGRSGRFECVAGKHTGPIMSEGRYFRHAGGPPVYLLGNFLDNRPPAHQRFSHTLLSEKISDDERQAMIRRAQAVHRANKMNIYLANRGDYHGLSTTPWLGTSEKNDKTRFDLARWKMFDHIIGLLDRTGITAELWFFADDSNFGKLSKADREHLMRYGMARLSAFPNTMFVLCLEWQEGWSSAQVASDIGFARKHNPWRRLWSVHGVNGDFAFPEQSWADFMATQPGNDIRPAACNAHTRYNTELAEKPLLVEELGHASKETRKRVRANMWAAFCGGAAGTGTGCDLARLRVFVEREKVPFWLMMPDNSMAENGFALLQYGREYVVYLPEGGKTAVLLPPGTYRVVWFNPREGALRGRIDGGLVQVKEGKQPFAAPDTRDWVLHLRRVPAGGDAGVLHEAEPLVRNGFFVWRDQAVLGWIQHNGWWRPGQRPNLCRRAIGDPRGDIRPCRTEDLVKLTDSMLRYGYPGFEHNFGLWFDRRRDAHDTKARNDARVKAPFLEQPWQRSGVGRAADGLSHYDLTTFNPWYFQRIKAFADLCDAKGTVLFYKFYMQHTLLEQQAHYMDFPWRPTNCIQKTRLPDRIPAANAFYDISNPVRRAMHRAYIRHCLDVLADNRNVVFLPSEEYTGALPFVQFMIDTIGEWERETGRHVTFGVGAPKDVLDAVLADPKRVGALDVLDLRCWWIRKDGSVAALPGGQQVPGRSIENGFQAAKETSPESVYHKISQYRRRFPNKAIIDAIQADRQMSWAFFMAGGSLLVRGQIHYPKYADPPTYIKPADVDIILPTYEFFRKHMAGDLPRMKPVDAAQAASGPAWCLADREKTFLVYVLHGGNVVVNLAKTPGRWRLRRFDPASGKLEDAGTAAGGKPVTISLPAERDGVVWAERM